MSSWASLSLSLSFTLISPSHTQTGLLAGNIRAIIAYRDYYACDAGCLDPPVQLGLQPVKFPVKLTEPLTAILYITGTIYVVLTNILTY